MIELFAKIGGGIIAIVLLASGFSLAFQNADSLKKNTADIENLNQVVVVLSGRVDNLRNTQQKLGATITTINASDQISSSRSVINTNFTNLNTGTIGVGTTSVASITTLSNLVSIGTITTGTWNGTTLTVAYGGTGSTTLSSNQVLLGNGTGNVSVVNGLGTSGQFLTSQGAGSAPQWTTSSVDQTLNYNWSGNHNFSGNVYTRNLNASSTLIIGGVTYVLPSAQGAASTTLRNDGSGNLTWQGIYASSTVFTASGTWVRPAYVRTVKVTVVGGGGGGGGASNTNGSCGAGGGGGEYRNGWINVSGNVTVTVGTGGAGGVGNAAGSNGNNSSFAGATTITANGGTGGGASGTVCTDANVGGAGGTGGSGGTVIVPGQVGENAGIKTNYSGMGGNTPLGYGGSRIIVGSASDGNAGNNYGSGGSGATDINQSATRNGGAGAAGIVIVEWNEQ